MVDLRRISPVGECEFPVFGPSHFRHSPNGKPKRHSRTGAFRQDNGALDDRKRLGIQKGQGLIPTCAGGLRLDFGQDGSVWARNDTQGWGDHGGGLAIVAGKHHHTGFRPQRGQGAVQFNAVVGYGGLVTAICHFHTFAVSAKDQIPFGFLEKEVSYVSVDSFPRGLHLRRRWLHFSRLQFKAGGPDFNAERRFMRYRHAVHPTILALLCRAFCPLGLNLSVFP
jgi:hypothetical protein